MERPGDTKVSAPRRFNDVDCPLYPDQYAIDPKICDCPRCRRIRWHYEWREYKRAHPDPTGFGNAWSNGQLRAIPGGPNEIESKIRHEADRRWRAWVPTKEHLSRPQLRYYLKQVRKEFYP
jgi:hypothetical protein